MKSTKEKLLEAATEIFARDGVSGATTRAIARRAGVNEVTLFRHFHNKEELLRRVVLRFSSRFAGMFALAPLRSADDLRRAVENYARLYAEKLAANETFVRTFFGELHRHPALGRRLFVEAGKPVRLKFVAYLRAAKRKGLVRTDVDPVTAVDALSGMLLGGLMRRPLTAGEYGTERYFKTCVKLYLKGLQP